MVDTVDAFASATNAVDDGRHLTPVSFERTPMVLRWCWLYKSTYDAAVDVVEERKKVEM